MDRILTLEFVRVTEAAPINSLLTVCAANLKKCTSTVKS